MDYSDIQKLWKSYQINTTADLDRYLENFRILFAYHSGKIENENITWHDTREIFENNKVLNYTGDPRTIFEMQNQKICYEVLKQKIVLKEPLSIELVKEIHRLLTTGTYDERRYIEKGERPGEFKKHDYITGIYEVGVKPEEVEPMLKELLQELNEFGGKDILLAAYFHANFENIHPFADGNGRVGRTLLNYYLLINNEPPVIIYEDEKTSYYKALQAFDSTESLEPLVKFLQMETIRTWNKTLERDEEKSEKCTLGKYMRGSVQENLEDAKKKMHMNDDIAKENKFRDENER